MNDNKLDDRLGYAFLGVMIAFMLLGLLYFNAAVLVEIRLYSDCEKYNLELKEENIPYLCK